MSSNGLLFNGQPAPNTPENCPNKGLIMFGSELDGRHGDAQYLYCKLCGAALKRAVYPEETRRHPA